MLYKSVNILLLLLSQKMPGAKYSTPNYYSQKGEGGDEDYFTSPHILQRGAGIGLGGAKYFTSDQFVQRGRRIGSIFRTIGKFLLPVAKKVVSVGKRVAKSDVVRNVGEELKKTAVEAGLDLAQAALEGDDLEESAAKSMSTAKQRVRDVLSDEIDKKRRKFVDGPVSRSNKKNNKKKKKKVKKAVYASKVRKSRLPRPRSRSPDALDSDSDIFDTE